jgi:hypothetical protein
MVCSGTALLFFLNFTDVNKLQATEMFYRVLRNEQEGIKFKTNTLGKTRT